jgi:hypothetical protein
MLNRVKAVLVIDRFRLLTFQEGQPFGRRICVRSISHDRTVMDCRADRGHCPYLIRGSRICFLPEESSAPLLHEGVLWGYSESCACKGQEKGQELKRHFH